MAKTVAFIDGFNLYHALIQKDEHDRRPYEHYRWLNYRKLVECFLHEKDVLSDVFYFTAYASWKTVSGIAKKERHQDFVRVQRNLDVKVVLGRFRPVWRKCLAECKKRYETYQPFKRLEKLDLQFISRLSRLSKDLQLHFQMPLIQNSE